MSDRHPVIGDVLRVRPPVTPHREWPAERLEAFRATVFRILDDGCALLDSTDGHYILYDLSGFVYVDTGEPVAPFPQTPCDKLGGCIRNPLDGCVRCGMVS